MPLYPQNITDDNYEDGMLLLKNAARTNATAASLMANPFLFISSDVIWAPTKGYVDLTAAYKHVFVQLSEAFETVCLKVLARIYKKNMNFGNVTFQCEQFILNFK